MPKEQRPAVPKTLDKSRKVKRVSLSEQRRSDIYTKVMEVSKSLFLTRGYDKTTTHQIADAAGILNGSLFNLFPTKEDILKAAIVQVYHEALVEAERLLKDDEDIIITIGFPAALELYIAYQYPKITELLFRAHSSWIVVNGLVDCAMDWMDNNMGGFESTEEKEEFRLNLFLLWGCLGSLISECYNGRPRSFDSALGSVLKVICSLFDAHLAPEKITAVEGRLSKMFKDGIVKSCIL